MLQSPDDANTHYKVGKQMISSTQSFEYNTLYFVLIYDLFEMIP